MHDPIELEVFKNLFHSIAEEMGAALRRTAFSPNIKERRDYSCAVFDSRGQVIAMGDHMPVHLGSMPMSVAAAIYQYSSRPVESIPGKNAKNVLARKRGGQRDRQRDRQSDNQTSGPAAAGDRTASLAPGDIVMLNDPFRGGTHLPDITLVMPVYISHPDVSPAIQRHISKHVILSGTESSPSELSVKSKDPYPHRAALRRDAALPRPGWRGRPPHIPDFYVASRAHHADVGGTFPGSMGPCREIYQEGFRIPPVKIMRAGKIVPDVLALLLNNVRTPEEREGDLGAQIAACQTGARRLAEICARYGLARTQRAAAGLLDYAEQLMRGFLQTVPPGEYRAEDFLDDDGVDRKPVRIAVTISVPARNERQANRKSRQANDDRRRIKDESRIANSEQRTAVTIDFTGSDPQVAGAVNAVEAITCSACFYVFRCLLREDVPATAGLMRPIRIIAPPGTVVNARPPAAVAGGNVETSQRIVDVLLRALAQAIPDRIPAAAAGTMNNLTIGGLNLRSDDLHSDDLRGDDSRLWGRGSAPPVRRAKSEHRTAKSDPQSFAYYETVAGGMGARPTKDGVSGVHTHMTNSLNTPAEALENAYPVRLRRYSLRANSGGLGEHTGGDGIVREIEVLTDAQVTLLADRRTRGPYGLAGGADGAPGRTVIIRSDGSEEELPGKTSVRLQAGDRIRIESPGGGGWGKPNR